VELFVARQPIFGPANALAGYELLYRSSATNNWAAGASAVRMSSDVIIHALLGIGMDRLTEGKLGFINMGREMLLDHVFELLDPGNVIIELLETVEPDDEVIAACERLGQGGYRLALDDFVYDERFDPLLRQAEIVKVDVLNRPMEELAEVAERLRPFRVQLLAERVETAEVRDGCAALGYTLFQGYYFSRPEILSRQEVSVEQATIIQLMNLLRDENASDADIEEAFRSDPSLSYKLLRMVNSAALGGRGIESIRHAIRLVGRGVLHRWLALLLVSSMATESGVDAELVHTAVLRARLCELLADAGGRRSASGQQFMVGLFSMIDVLLKVPMEEILDRVDLSPEVRDALLRRTGPYAGSLELVEAYETGRWDAVSDISADMGVAAPEVPELYLQSLSWVRERVRVADT
jgi:EAL and modified HD-GYP domain-containing signal transduction protein